MKNNDYIGAIRKIPLKISKLYVHAYQSSLFNETIDKYIKAKPKGNIKIPIIGFGTELESYPKEIQKITKEIMKKEKITFRDFIIRSLPDISSEGSERNLFIEVKGLKMENIEQDELNKGKYKAALSFSLPKGCYATVVVEHIFNLNRNI